MRLKALAGAVGLLAAALSATSAMAQPRPSITLYEGPGYSGRSITLYADESNLNGSGFNDRAMSVRVRGGVWKLCEDRDYRSRCEIIDRDTPDLGVYQFNRKVSSIGLEGYDSGRRPP